MNAYELAKEHSELLADESQPASMWFRKKCADMLRQQADRIADHEKTFNEMCELYEKQLDKQADRIAELEKETNDLKVQLTDALSYKLLNQTRVKFASDSCESGWVTIETPQTKQCKDCGEINPAEIHTCSPQTRSLSDEEILGLWCEFGQMYTKDQIKIQFGRAIEAKVRGKK